MENNLDEKYLEDLVLHIAQSISSYPDAARIETKKDERGILFIIHLSRGEEGKMIGREAVTINAIRHIVTCAGIERKIVAHVVVYSYRSVNWKYENRNVRDRDIYN